jgi:para-nitrobenzyl esterase
MMSRCFSLLLLLLLLLPLVGCGCYSDDEPCDGPDDNSSSDQVTIDDGRLQGVQSDTVDVTQYLGIPYAQPPVVDLRWVEPQAPEPWLEIRDATAVSEPCIQGVLNPQSDLGNGSEDCLFLNVSTPQQSSDPLPVLVWFHGSDNDSGFSAQRPTGIDAMAALADATGAVVVSVNARLGFLGFTALAELVVESANNTTGNYHHLDQVAALQWVRDNIAAFNGNPLNVTLLGQAAGANDVCLHLSSPLSAGLFQRAILHSSSCLSAALAPLATRLQQGLDYLGFWSCDGAVDVLDCLREQDPLVLREALFDAGKPTDTFAATPASTARFAERATNDGYAFTSGVIEDILGTESTAVPVIVGVNLNEYTLYRQHVDLVQPTTLGGYTLAIQTFLPQYDNSADLLNLTSVLYPVGDYDSYSDAFADLMGDAVYGCPGIKMADIFSSAGRTVYFYHFLRPINNSLLLLRQIGVPGDDAPALGVAQSADISYLWDDQPMQDGSDPGATVQAVQGYWSSFAQSGTPSADDEPGWSAYDTVAGRFLEIGEDIISTERFKTVPCLFFNGG